MNKALALTLCCVLFASATAMTKDAFNVDQATVVLEELLDEAQNNLRDLNNNWDVTKPILEANIAAIEEQLANKQAECAGLDVVLADHEKELDDARKYVAWLVKRIAENKDRIEVILAQRCQQNTLFVETIKNDKIALSLVQFLRAQVNAKESFDFAQRKAFMKHLNSFLAVYRKGDFSELIQLQKQVAADYEVNVNTDVHGRSNEEIGSQHVDNDKGELELENFHNGVRKSWGDVRAELLEILADLEATIVEKMARGQEDEVNASIAAAEYKLKLEHEIEVYEGELARWSANVSRLEGVVANDQENVARCRREETEIKSALEVAVRDLQVATDEYNHKRTNFEEEIEVFHEVLLLYQDSTGSQGEDFKARADDFIDDGNFDNADYADREVPDIQALGA